MRFLPQSPSFYPAFAPAPFSPYPWPKADPAVLTHPPASQRRPVLPTITPAIRRPILPARQGLLLALLSAVGGRCRNLDYQKLLFLCCQEAPPPPLYEFVPYKFGAFSFTSYADRRRLIASHLLVADDDYWHLTEPGRAAVLQRAVPAAACTTFARRYAALSGEALVAETYRRFPYHAIRSTVAGRLLAHDHAALSRIEAARPATSSGALFTIGYQGRSLESYLNTLLRAGVTVLCDVRRNPLSRKYGFSRQSLASACEGVGLRYEHLPALGIASEYRQGLATQTDYDALFAAYVRIDLPKQSVSIATIAGWLRAGDAVALTCYERLPQQCHRHCVAEAIEQLTPAPGATIHL